MINILKYLRSNREISIFMVSILLLGFISACSDGNPMSENQRTAANLPNPLSSSELGAMSNLPSQESNHIIVRGNAVLEVEPDVATINLSIESRESTVVVARENAASAMLTLLKKLSETGIGENSIHTNSFSITPITQWATVKDDTGEYSEQRVLGYTVVNSVSIDLHDIDRVGEIIDLAAVTGGDLIRIGSIKFNVKNPERYSNQLRMLAVENALKKAKSYAEAAQVELGNLTSLEEIYSPSMNTMESSNYRMMAEFNTPINPDEMQLSLNIIAAYEINQKQ